MEVQNKITHLNHFLKLALNSQDSLKASKNLQVAEELLSEVEFATLANPAVNDDNIHAIVALTRSVMWGQAKQHVQNLKRGEAACFMA